MTFVREVHVGGNNITPLSWDLVKESIVNLKNCPYSTIQLAGANGQMTMEFVVGQGYYISAFGRDEIEEWLAIDEQLPEEMVSANISGHVDEVPRRILVSEEIALDVGRHFYIEGERSSKHNWIRSLDVM